MLLGILCETFPDKSFKRSTFYDVLQKDFPQLKFPEGHSFAKCNTCVSLKDRKSKETNRFRREEIEEELNAHYKEQSKERKYYAHKKSLSVQNPFLFLSVVIDGMDQMKTRMPRLYPFSKEFDRDWQLPVHVTCVKVHGEVDEAYLYFDVNQVCFSFFSFFSFFFFSFFFFFFFFFFLFFFCG